MESSRVSDRVGQVALLTGVTIALCFLLHTLVRIFMSRAPTNTPNKSPVPDSPQSRRPVPDAPQYPPTKRVGLQQVNPLPEKETKTDIDIIAIHGLDTKSPDTWLWDPKGARVNWLADRHMLPARFQTARIFTCDWPADLLEQSDFVQKPIEAYARSLLASINSRPPVTDTTPGNDDRPILFIASCLGGIILMKALDIASHEYLSVKTATRGIIFLATPFRGTSFENVANWAEPGLRMWASVQNKNVARLLENVKATPDLNELVRRFTSLCQDHNLTDSVFNFYETGKLSFTRKIFPWLPASLSESTPLVDQQSATLDFVQHPLPLDRPHVLMNKFFGPDDGGYRSICGMVDVVLCKIRNGQPLEKADLWIQNTCYSLKNLQIERLSGDLLPMDRCYINLAIVEHAGRNDRQEEDTAQKTSPFSLFARLNIEAPESTEISLPSLFEPRKTQGGRERQPSRILIRGRAGVGKTTLCKKIVYEFTHGEKWQGWRELYDRVLWVPLRNLKREERRSIAGYNMAHLFRHEFFSQSNGEALADALCQTLENDKSGRTLFILDGLDEVSQDLDGDMLGFLKRLLNQPHVIITSRPHAKIPPDVDPMHLELETIGFFTEQVEAYVEKTFAHPETGTTDSNRPAEILSYLQQRPLIQGLVRIPVQLDALCYSWDSFDKSADESAPETMTAIYKAIEQSLWKKDIVRLGKKYDGQPLTSAHIEDTDLDGLDSFIKDEICFLEGIAFTGLQHDVIDFKPQHWSVVYRHFKVPGRGILPNMTLPRLSFLRTSDTSPKQCNYHFLHLTFQEYFAARYFARQWRKAQPLTCISLGSAENKGVSRVQPADFLQKHKYNTRYDIFWRFVAGSLEGQAAEDFFHAIEDQPRDWLGPAHQRLIMHCLSEASPELASRRNLEETLAKWLIFECKVARFSHLVTDSECPKLALETAIRSAPTDAKIPLLDSLALRPAIPSFVLDFSISCLEDKNPNVRWTALRVFQNQTSLGPETLQALTARLDDEDEDVRVVAARAFQKQTSLGPETLQALTARLDDEYWRVREAAARALQTQTSLGPETLQALTARLDDEDEDVRVALVRALQNQTSLGPETLQALMAWLDDEDEDVRVASVRALQNQTSLGPETLQALTARLDDEDWYVRAAAAIALQNQTTLSPETLQALMAQLEEKHRYLTAAEESEVLRRQPPLSLQAATIQNKDEDEDESQTLQAIVTKINDKDWRTRRNTMRTLGRQASLGPEILQAIAARFEDEDEDVRAAAVGVLKSQTPLDSEILQAIAARLEDEDGDVRKAAVGVLGSQTPLDLEILQAIAARLEDEDEDVRVAAVGVLVSQPELDLNKFVQYSEAFYQELLQKSFREPLSLSVQDSCLIMAVDGKEAIWPCRQGQFTEAIEKAQQNLEDCEALA